MYQPSNPSNLHPLGIHPMLGKILGGRYEIINYLGGGGYGQTYLAKDNHLPNNPQCVVKQLKPQTEDQFNLKTASRLFNTEAEVLYQLGSHHKIPRLFAHFEENQEFYLVQEHIEGIELSQELAEGQFSETEVVLFLQEILEILEFVHTQKVIHRDINPRNIIRRKLDNQLVLIDFGAVKQISTQLFNTPEQQYNKTVAIGTVGYMPSEQLNGNPGFYSDIYAVGAIAIMALTGLDPTHNQLPREPKTGEISWRNRAFVSPSLARIIDRMVRSHFQERYQSAKEVLSDLQTVSAVSAIPSTTVNLQISLKAAAAKNVAEIDTLPRSPRQLINPWQIGLGIAIISTIFISSKFLTPQTVNTSSQTASISKIPAKAATFFNQGEKLRTSQQYQKALIAYDRALTIAPTYATASWRKCYTLNQLQRYTEAIVNCDRTLQIKPDYYQALWSKGYALDALKRYDDALVNYNKALAIKPDFAESWSNKGATLNYLKRYEEALIAYDEALKVRADLPEAWNNKGTVLNRLQRYEEALNAYNQAIKFRPNYPEAWNNRGVALANMRQVTEAIDCYEKAIQLQPNYQPAIENRDRLLKLIKQ